MSRIAGILISLLIATVTFEAGFAAILAYNGLFHFPPNSLFRTYYLNKDRNIIIYQPGCGRYDDQLTYTFNPGSCNFKNREFDVQFDINSAGLRDDEASLTAPDVIVLGDSHASGWGIAQSEAFPERISTSTGLKVLNAAVPSYGTAREMRLLQRLDTKHLKYLIIQYCNNDVSENKSYFDHNKTLPITPESEFNQIRAQHLIDRGYTPLRHTIYTLQYVKNKLHNWIGSLRSSTKVYTDEKTANREIRNAKRFLEILSTAQSSIPTDTVILVVDINDPSQSDTLFNDSLREVMLSAAKDQQAWLSHIHIIDLGLNYPAHYFNLDEHINPAGHAHAAEVLVNAMKNHSHLPNTP